MVMFASVDDLADRLQVDFDTDDRVRATRLLEHASGVVQQVTRQTIEHVTSDTVTLQPTYNCLLLLPELPVTDVVSVTVQGAALPSGSYRWTSSGLIYAEPTTNAWRYEATVVYAHGHDPVPDDIAAVVLDMSARAWQNPRGVMSEQIGTYSARYPNNKSGLALLDDEWMLLAQYRPTPG